MRQEVITVRVFLFIMFVSTLAYNRGFAQTGKEAILRVQKTTDFSVDGKGTASNWLKAKWISIPQRSITKRMSRNIAPAPTITREPEQLSTRAKVLYSDSGIYFLFQCEDRVLQATMEEDFVQLWWEDVIEIFLWPDENDGTYFEYQLSPLNYELILKITRDERSRSSWLPSSYRGGRRTRHKTSVKGGKRVSGASITQWTAEVFIPYQLLHPAYNVPPKSGTMWRVNLYRNDYDTGNRTRWEWQPVDGGNHDLELFGTFLFK